MGLTGKGQTPGSQRGQEKLAGLGSLHRGPPAVSWAWQRSFLLGSKSAPCRFLCHRSGSLKSAPRTPHPPRGWGQIDSASYPAPLLTARRQSSGLQVPNRDAENATSPKAPPPAAQPGGHQERIPGGACSPRAPAAGQGTRLLAASLRDRSRRKPPRPGRGHSAVGAGGGPACPAV